MIKSSKTLLKGLCTVFKHLFIPAVTLEYPEKRPDLPERFRGKHSLKGCIACGTCVKACPANAIILEKNSENKLVSFKVDLKKCIFCGNCQYYCPVKAIKLGKEFELGTSDSANLLCELLEREEEEEEC